MKPEDLIRQIETYSNAIVGFSVLQALAFASSFGSSEFFNCAIRTASYLAEGLTLMLIVVMVLSVMAIRQLGRTLGGIAGEFRSVVQNIYAAKIVAVVVFGLLPLCLTVGYGVMDYPSKKACAKPIAERPAP